MSESDGAGLGVLGFDCGLGIELFLEGKPLAGSQDIRIGLQDIEALFDAVVNDLIRAVVVLVCVLSNSITTASLIVFW